MSKTGSEVTAQGCSWPLSIRQPFRWMRRSLQVMHESSGQAVGPSRSYGSSCFLSFRASFAQIECLCFSQRSSSQGTLQVILQDRLKVCLQGAIVHPAPSSKDATYLQKCRIIVIYENIRSSLAIPSESPPFQ